MGVVGVVVFVVPALAGVVLLLRGLRRLRAVRVPCCRACGFDLRAHDGADAPRCPECGADLARPRAVRRPSSRAWQRPVVVGSCLLVVAAALWVPASRGDLLRAMPLWWKIEIEHRFGGAAGRVATADGLQARIAATPADDPGSPFLHGALRRVADRGARRRLAGRDVDAGAANAEHAALVAAEARGMIDDAWWVAWIDRHLAAVVEDRGSVRGGEVRAAISWPTLDARVAGPWPPAGSWSGSFDPTAFEIRIVDLSVDDRPVTAWTRSNGSVVAVAGGSRVDWSTRFGPLEVRASRFDDGTPIPPGPHELRVLVEYGAPASRARGTTSAWRREHRVTVEVAEADRPPPVEAVRERLRRLVDAGIRRSLEREAAGVIALRLPVDSARDLEPGDLMSLVLEHDAIDHSRQPSSVNWSWSGGVVVLRWSRIGASGLARLRFGPTTIQLRGDGVEGWTGAVRIDEPIVWDVELP